ncbi:hypothetical protein [Adhaeribacter soli]|uniref:ApeA N-terminal domain-containing protein n=1 Tax=Adhaeribacter soli TaxID=2607655 RepID=A0A5N1ILU0_9BACT|nr:hypothetical protein [Adhaeribacter soli]KAA9327318.1 hypothetical protein F0P94_15485 [Adhaeribacter soli]
MSNYHCLDIEFLNIDFNLYSIKRGTEVSKVHHAHLYTKKNKIELRIFFDDKTYFGEKLMDWASKVDWKKFGSFLKVEVTKNYKNERLQRVDLSEAKLLSCTDSSGYYEDRKRYIKIKIDTVKFYWDPVEGENHTAEFYFADKGFRVVEPFYSFLSPTSFLRNDGKFDIGRMKSSTMFYKLGKSSFRPEFNFVAKDNRKERVATVTKEPKIQFKYKKGITEKEAVFYGDVVLKLASFYHHIKIDYILSRIHLPENTITIKNIEQKNFLDTSGNLWGFEIYWNFNKFLQASWQKETVKNFAILSKAIALFNQSLLVDSYSTFLIRYNIIETCDKQKQDNVRFTSALDKKQTKAKQNEALEKLLETIDKKEHEDFKKRWHSVQTFLQNKPMKNQLVSFLESQNLDTKTFPVKIDDLKKLRNNITHGSIDQINPEQLRQANILLYRISGILILNLMGIKEWKLNIKIH